MIDYIKQELPLDLQVEASFIYNRVLPIGILNNLELYSKQ